MPRIPPDPVMVQLLTIAAGGRVTVSPDGSSLLVTAPVRIVGEDGTAVVRSAVPVPIDRPAFDDAERMRLLAVSDTAGGDAAGEVKVTRAGRLMLGLWEKRMGDERRRRLWERERERRRGRKTG